MQIGRAGVSILAVLAAASGSGCDLGAPAPVNARASNGVANPFQCDAAKCVQRFPRLPDDGGWQCAEVGVALCVGGGRAAGVVEGPPDPHFVCGDRRGTWPEEDGRVCIDVSPERPPDATALWDCQFDHPGGAVTRVCTRATSVPCGGCPKGTLCAMGHCASPPARPNCWFDTDCGPKGRCVLGGCAGDR